MEWVLKQGKHRDREVLGITDILVLDGEHREAVNIIIK